MIDKNSVVQASRNDKIVIFIISISILLVVGAFIAGLLLDTSENGVNVDTDATEETLSEEVTADEEGEEPAENIVNVEYGIKELTINWYAAEDRIHVPPHAGLLQLYTSQIDANTAEITAIELGSISGGKYDGGTLQLNTMHTGGVGSWNVREYSVHYDEKEVILDKYGTVIGSFKGYAVHDSSMDILVHKLGTNAGAELTFDVGAFIPEFDYEMNIASNNGVDLAFRGIGSVSTDAAGDAGNVVFAGGHTYIMAENGQYFYRIREDDMMVTYSLDIPFLENDGEALHTPAFYWIDSGESVWNAKQYSSARPTGCGYEGQISVIDIDTVGPLAIAGEVRGEGVIYVPTGYDTEYAREFEEAYTYAFKNGASWDSIQRPVFFYEDEFGRWLEFISADFISAGECGKPVIYLYPEEEVDLLVEVDPKGGFTKVIPDYNDGWRVTATPNSVITNHDDGLEYPYLFWEGRGDVYEEPDRYWVVEQVDVKKFLTKTLLRVGLNRVEIYDFMEFWYPRMQDAPYYKIGFHGTRVMDLLAPLNISGEDTPDSILRILMDYTELEEPIEGNPPRYIPRFVRDGFTVIEWGGVLRD